MIEQNIACTDCGFENSEEEELLIQLDIPKLCQFNIIIVMRKPLIYKALYLFKHFIACSFDIELVALAQVRKRANDNHSSLLLQIAPI